MLPQLVLAQPLHQIKCKMQINSKDYFGNEWSFFFLIGSRNMSHSTLLDLKLFLILWI